LEKNRTSCANLFGLATTDPRERDQNQTSIIILDDLKSIEGGGILRGYEKETDSGDGVHERIPGYGKRIVRCGRRRTCVSSTKEEMRGTRTFVNPS